MSNERAQAQACRQLSRALAEARTAKETASLPTIIGSFMDDVGGPQELGRMLAKDFKDLRGHDLSPEQKLTFHRKDGLILQYFQMLLKASSDRDSQLASADLASFSDEDLRAMLVSIAVSLMREDTEFREEVVTYLLREDPAFIDRIAGSVVDGYVVDASKSV